MLFVNFKAYNESTGKNAVELAELCKKVSAETGKKIIPVVQAVDIFNIKPSYAQHVDEVEPGAYTGHISIEALKQAGAVGAILNHSENRIPMDKIKAVVERCKLNNFPILVCAQDPDEVGLIAALKPDFVAYEPPELIGGDISVSTAKPEVITESVEKAGDVPLIVGAGVKNAQDVKISMQLGAKGILVASGIVKAENPEQALRDLVKEL